MLRDVSGPYHSFVSNQPVSETPKGRAVVRRKGGDLEVLHFQTGSARLLPRLLVGRTSGPVFGPRTLSHDAFSTRLTSAVARDGVVA